MLLDHVGKRGGRETLKEIGQPPARTGSLLELLERVLRHEKEVTAGLHRIYDLSVLEKDYGVRAPLQWFVNGQIEEEKADTEIVSMLLRKAGGRWRVGTVHGGSGAGGASPFAG